MNPIVIALDAMGGDHGPKVIVPAALQALQQNSNLKLILVGDQQILREHLTRCQTQECERLVIHHASQVVEMSELPSSALRNKKDSSMRVAINLVKEQIAHACVSAGNTGALMATARFVLKTLPGIDRPAIIGELPNRYGTVRVLDLGANIDSTAEHLFQFAVMGHVLVNAVENISQPRIGLLNIGQEEIKGNDIIKQASQKLANHPGLHYVGFIEGNDIFMSQLDIVVCDGFVGNVALKTCEGCAKLIKSYLQQAFTKSIWGKLVALAALPLLKRVGQHIEPARYNGASLLGLCGIVIKSHGSASILGFSHAIHQAVLQVQKNVPQRIHKHLAEFLSQESP